jgi:hypothetical protein
VPVPAPVTSLTFAGRQHGGSDDSVTRDRFEAATSPYRRIAIGWPARSRCYGRFAVRPTQYAPQRRISLAWLHSRQHTPTAALASTIVKGRDAVSKIPGAASYVRSTLGCTPQMLQALAQALRLNDDVTAHLR